MVRNIKEGGFKGDLYTVNPKQDEIQGLKCYRQVEDLPQVDLAVLAVASKFAEHTVEVLAKEKAQSIHYHLCRFR